MRVIAARVNGARHGPPCNFLVLIYGADLRAVRIFNICFCHIYPEIRSELCRDRVEIMKKNVIGSSAVTIPKDKLSRSQLT
jgi:hypothetical protein